MVNIWYTKNGERQCDICVKYGTNTTCLNQCPPAVRAAGREIAKKFMRFWFLSGRRRHD